MTSTFPFPPAGLYDKDHIPPQYPADQHRPSTDSVDSTHLSPVLSRVNSESLSPSIINADTPSGDSNYHPSDFSDLEDDPFFGTNFGIPGGNPIFLDDPSAGLDSSVFASDTPSSDTGPSHNEDGTYPMTPAHTVHTTSPRSELRGALRLSTEQPLPTSVSPRDLQMPFNPAPLLTQESQLTPSQSSSCRSSEDGVPAPIEMTTSPLVTLTFWGKDNETPIHPPIDQAFDSPTTVRGPLPGDLAASTNDAPSVPRDAFGQWKQDPFTGQAGHDPASRPPTEVTSLNDMAASRGVAERNDAVGQWLSDEMQDLALNPPPEQSSDAIAAIDKPRDDDGGVDLGHETTNQYKDGQTYFTGNQGPMSDEDYMTILSNRNWANGPMVHPIYTGRDRHQPQTSQAAIEKFERRCRDNDSIVSRAATWGTRRLSLPSIIDQEMEPNTSGNGNILKKFSLSRGDKGSKPNLLTELRGKLMRRPSATSIRKRNRDNNDEDSTPGSDSRGSQDSLKRDSVTFLTPQARMSSWGKKPTPSINMALVSMGQNLGSVGTTHSRSGSISATPVTSPKSPFGLSVGSLRRPRSKSEAPKLATANLQTETSPSLVDLWRKNGGPPVANLAKPTANAEADDDEDEGDDTGDDAEMRESSNLIDEFTPDMAGFQQHILKLNPNLATTNNYLVERIAHQQITRYKQLLKSKVSHMKLGANCPSGKLCIAMGGSACILDQVGDSRELDPLSTVPDDSDGTPTEGRITNDSFPSDIPMPPTSRLPAELECQLCFQGRKFQKPSDWTKHVHEDVQPFTCTWDKCREPKIFKRKADWVRHENEGHRHLEWWVCDVEGCHHQCYRRDNFLQHLVREHKFPEPKVKTKAAIKKAGGGDPTWHKVELCHMETPTKPQDEPCRFCGKSFLTWKKLTVHLAKHMEQISLPVLRLVAVKARELSADTIISPIQDLPPRSMHLTPTQATPAMGFPSHPQQISPNHTQGPFPGQSQIYPVMPHEQPYQPSHQPGFYPQQYGNISHHLHDTSYSPHAINTSSFNQTNALPVTTMAPTGFGQSNTYIPLQNTSMEQYSHINGLGLQNQSPPMGPMNYDGMMGPSSGNGSPFSGHESISSYTHSPNPNIHNADVLWDHKPPMYQ